MEIIGYIGYAILIFLALAWTLGVRLKLGSGLSVIMGALFFTTAALLLAVMELNKIHSWWLIPLGYIFMIVCTFILSARIPILSNLIKIIGSLYATIIRVGIPSEKIIQAKHVAAKEAVERFVANKERQ
jgi:hypothetical protein